MIVNMRTDRARHEIAAAGEWEAYLDHPLLPEVPSVGVKVFDQAAPGGLRPAARADVYEICYLARGSAEWWRGGRLIEAGPNSAFLNIPGEWHGGRDALLHPCCVCWAQVHLPPGASLPGLSSAESEAIHSRLSGIEPRVCQASPELRDHFERLLTEYRHADAPLAVIKARAILHEIIVTFLRDQDRERQSVITPEIQRSLAWMSAHIMDSYPIEAAAQVANMSIGHFHERFLHEVGYTPGEYRMRERLHRAKTLLRDPTLPITEIAHSLGYSTSQYFATVFRKLVGLSPRQYRQITQL
jgi:AraC-like DNA-binding protein